MLSLRRSTNVSDLSARQAVAHGIGLCEFIVDAHGAIWIDAGAIPPLIRPREGSAGLHCYRDCGADCVRDVHVQKHTQRIRGCQLGYLSCRYLIAVLGSTHMDTAGGRDHRGTRSAREARATESPSDGRSADALACSLNRLVTDQLALDAISAEVREQDCAVEWDIYRAMVRQAIELLHEQQEQINALTVTVAAMRSELRRYTRSQVEA